MQLDKSFTFGNLGVAKMANSQDELFAEICSKLEKTNNFKIFLDEVQSAIDYSDNVQIDMVSALSSVLVDSDSVNIWFFQLPVDYEKPLIWLSVVYNTGTTKFVWSVGYISKMTQTIQNLIKPNLSLLDQIQLLQIPKSPPFLIYFEPVQSSTWQMSSDLPVIEDINELDILQVSYEGSNLKEDVDQTLIMNVNFLQMQGLKLENRVRDFGSVELINFCEQHVFPNLGLLTALHVEVHNWGHFLGYFPFSNDKNISSYESVEEYRACLVGGVFGIHLLPSKISLALCVVIVLNRLLIYGFEPYLRSDEDKTFQDVREISVAVFFYQNLKMEAVLSIQDQKLDLDVENLIAVFLKTGLAIQEMEKKANNDQQILEKYAIDAFSKAYPDRQFPKDLSDFYSCLSQKYYP